MAHARQTTWRRPKIERSKRAEPTDISQSPGAPVSARTRRALVGSHNRQIKFLTKSGLDTSVSTQTTTTGRQSKSRGKSSVQIQAPPRTKSAQKRHSRQPRTTYLNRRVRKSSKEPAERYSKASLGDKIADTDLERIRAGQEEYRETGDVSAFSELFAPFIKENQGESLGDWEYNKDKKRWCRVDKLTGFIVWAPTKASFL